MHWHEQEALLWSQEMARSTRRFEEAVRDGLLAPAGEPAQARLLWAETMARIAESKKLCRESHELVRRAGIAGPGRAFQRNALLAP